MSKNKRLEGVQILRAIAFLEIFLGHCGAEFLAASFGVAIFMILSGFCMAVNYLPKAEKMDLSPLSAIKFGLAKVKRLYPLHLIMLAVIYVIVKMPTSASAIKRLVREVLLIKCWMPHSEDYFAYNGVAWYLSTYLFVCMMAPYMIWLVSKIKNKAQLLTGGTMIYAVMLCVGYYVSMAEIPIGDTFAKWITYICPFYRMLDFSLGVMLGWLFLNRSKQCEAEGKKKHLLEIFALIAFVVVEWAYLPVKENYMGIGYNVYFTLTALLLVWVFAVNGGFLTKLLNNPPLMWVGNLSGYLFLIHQVVIRAIRMCTEREILGVWYVPYVAVLSFVISVIGSYVYIYFEKRIQKAKKA